MCIILFPSDGFNVTEKEDDFTNGEHISGASIFSRKVCRHFSVKCVGTFRFTFPILFLITALHAHVTASIFAMNKLNNI